MYALHLHMLIPNVNSFLQSLATLSNSTYTKKKKKTYFLEVFFLPMLGTEPKLQEQ